MAVFRKELKDALRDRRTLFSTIVLPTLVIPLLTFGTLGIGSKIVSSARKAKPVVMIVGEDANSEFAAALAKSGRFALVGSHDDYRQQIVDKKLAAALALPRNFTDAVRRGEMPRAQILHYEGELKSGFAVAQLEQFLRDFRDQHVNATLASRGLSTDILRPFQVARQNVAPPEKVGGNLIGGLVPYLIIILCFTGAMYPAIDLTAGEKERGTMETLLCSPASRLDLVLGKFLLVLASSLSAMAMALLSMTVTAAATGTILIRGAQEQGAAVHSRLTNGLVPLLDPLGLLGVLVMIVPVAVLFSAVQFTVALFARTSKEAQSYLGPMVMVVLLPAIIGMLPGVDLNAKLAFVPLLNLSLVCKEMLSGVWHWDYIGIIFGSTCIYAGTALALAVRMFNREEVIFRT
jgi:sodium transport system permease protein